VFVLHNADMSPSSLRLRTPIAALLVIGALLAAGCGGSGLADDPQAVLDAAKLPPSGPNAADLTVEFSPSAGGDGGLLGGPLTIEATSQGDQEQGVVADARVVIGPASLTVEAIANADNTWVLVGDTWYELGQSLPFDVGGIGTALGSLRESVVDPRAVAVEDIEGVECDRISGGLDSSALDADVLGGLLGGLPIDPSALLSGDAQIDLWVSRDDDVVRRIRIDASGEAGAGEASAGGDLVIDLTVVPSEVPEITPPADAEPITALLAELLGDQLGDLGDQLGDLGGLLGGLGGLGGLGVSSTMNAFPES
jgi:hypothetical protein